PRAPAAVAPAAAGLGRLRGAPRLHLHAFIAAGALHRPFLPATGMDGHGPALPELAAGPAAARRCPGLLRLRPAPRAPGPPGLGRALRVLRGRGVSLPHLLAGAPPRAVGSAGR